jgi:hypothetical protein
MYKHEQHAHICATNDVKLLNHESIQKWEGASERANATDRQTDRQAE